MKDRSLEQSNIDIISLDLGSFLAGELPSQIIDVAREVLDQKIEEGQLRGAFVQGFGRDLHMHLSTYNGDLQQADSLTVSGQAALAAGLKALEEAQVMGLGSAEAEKISSLPPHNQATALNLRSLNFPYTERGAEPIFVARRSMPVGDFLIEDSLTCFLILIRVPDAVSKEPTRLIS